MLRLLMPFALLVALAACTVPSIHADDAAIAAARHVDPSGSYLRLFTSMNNRSGSGAHTGLLINASQRVIFDPAGSFEAVGVPERADVLYGITPRNEFAYQRYQSGQKFTAVIQTIPVTAAQAEMALTLARQAGPVPQSLCTTATVGLLRQIPGFEGLSSTYFPKNLMEQVARMPGVTTRRYAEDQPGFDLQAAYARELALARQ